MLLGDAAYDRLSKRKSADFLERELDKMFERGVGYICIADARYPEPLRQKQVVPPCVLFYKGDISVLQDACVAVVGTRHCSAYGREVAEKLCAELAGYAISVVSGMATGVDAYAHAAALNAGGRTAAILGSGLDKPTPLANLELFDRIAENGLVLSEYPLGTEASKYTFPERNRLIAGASRACVIVEAAAKSGALITADRALEQGREVFAVPGNITSPKSEGTNTLIKNGARPLTATQDILAFFNMQNTKINQNHTSIPLDIFEQKLYNLLRDGALSVNELAERSGFSLPEVITLLFSLEMKEEIKREPNNMYTVAGRAI
jgi:DNA processing protein